MFVVIWPFKLRCTRLRKGHGGVFLFFCFALLLLFSFFLFLRGKGAGQTFANFTQYCCHAVPAPFHCIRHHRCDEWVEQGYLVTMVFAEAHGGDQSRLTDRTLPGAFLSRS